MLRHSKVLAAVVVLLAACPIGWGKAKTSATGSLSVSGRARVGNKTVTLKKKRFYLFRGGLDANKSLIESLKAAQAPSRDCFYCQMHASAEFMEWLKRGDGGCDTPYCREISADDVSKVPEFRAAYDKGSKQFQKKPELAQKWLVTNLDKGLLHGLYDERKKMIDSVLSGLQPVQTAMTDNGGSVIASFLNIPLSSTDAEKFVFTNLVPVEIGEKSYVWACEVEVASSKPVKTPPLDAPETSKRVKKCEVIVRDLAVCAGEACQQK